VTDGGDTAGLKGWKTSLETGVLTLEQAAAGFTGLPEFQERYGALSDKEFIALKCGSGRPFDAYMAHRKLAAAMSIIRKLGISHPVPEVSSSAEHLLSETFYASRVTWPA
jgi:hypothetical protein